MIDPPAAPRASHEPPLGDLVLKVARTLRRRWVAALEPWGLSPHHARALGAIGDGGTDDAPALRLSDLAAALRIAPRSATEVVDALVERALVERVDDPSDRRVVVVRLTGAGAAVRAQVEAARAAAASQLFERLDPRGRADLAHLLGQLLDP